MFREGKHFSYTFVSHVNSLFCDLLACALCLLGQGPNCATLIRLVTNKELLGVCFVEHFRTL